MAPASLDWLHITLAVGGGLGAILQAVLAFSVKRELKRHDEDRVETKQQLARLEERVNEHGKKQAGDGVLLQGHSALLVEHSTKLNTNMEEISKLREKTHGHATEISGLKLLLHRRERDKDREE